MAGATAGGVARGALRMAARRLNISAHAMAAPWRRWRIWRQRLAGSSSGGIWQRVAAKTSACMYPVSANLRRGGLCASWRWRNVSY